MYVCGWRGGVEWGGAGQGEVDGVAYLRYLLYLQFRLQKLIQF